MKILLISIVLLSLNAEDVITKYADAFNPDRYAACAAAKAEADSVKNMIERSGCNCEKIDYDGWRCLVRYTYTPEPSNDAKD
jgi:hypothetical protein